MGVNFPEEERQQEWNRLGIYFHRTYIGAAINAYKCKLISMEGLSRVGKAAVKDFARMRTDHHGLNFSWDIAALEISEDVKQANLLLDDALRVELPPRGLLAGGTGMVRTDSMKHYLFTQ